MFGDTFGTKSDYVKGMEYQMRRAYMGDDPGEVVSTPPDTMFLSRDQGEGGGSERSECEEGRARRVRGRIRGLGMRKESV